MLLDCRELGWQFLTQVDLSLQPCRILLWQRRLRKPRQQRQRTSRASAAGDSSGDSWSSAMPGSTTRQRWSAECILPQSSIAKRTSVCS